MARPRQEAVAVAENKGREKFAELMKHTNLTNFIEIKYQFTDKQFDKVDAVSFDNRIAWEIKNRDILPGKYLQSGYMIEKNKYDQLQQYEHGYYTNFFKNGDIMIWDVQHIDRPLKWEYKWCTATTADGTYEKGKVKKLCANLYTEDAIVIHNYEFVNDRRDWAWKEVERWNTSTERREEERKKEQERQRRYEEDANRQATMIALTRELMAQIDREEEGKGDTIN